MPAFWACRCLAFPAGCDVRDHPSLTSLLYSPARGPQRTPARHDGMRALCRLALAEDGRALLSPLPPPASPKRWLDEPNAEPEAEAEPKEELEALCSAAGLGAGLVRAW